MSVEVLSLTEKRMMTKSTAAAVLTFAFGSVSPADTVSVAQFDAETYTVAEGDTVEITVVRTDDIFEIEKSVWIRVPPGAPLTVNGLDDEGVLWLPYLETTVEITAQIDGNRTDDTYVLRLESRGGVDIGARAETRLTVRDRRDVPALPLVGLATLGVLLTAAASLKLKMSTRP